jgi:hypothetical protein
MDGRMPSGSREREKKRSSSHERKQKPKRLKIDFAAQLGTKNSETEQNASSPSSSATKSSDSEIDYEQGFAMFGPSPHRRVLDLRGEKQYKEAGLKETEKGDLRPRSADALLYYISEKFSIMTKKSSSTRDEIIEPSRARAKYLINSIKALNNGKKTEDSIAAKQDFNKKKDGISEKDLDLLQLRKEIREEYDKFRDESTKEGKFNSSVKQEIMKKTEDILTRHQALIDERKQVHHEYIERLQNSLDKLNKSSSDTEMSISEEE